jgi:hypothetical protein
MLVGVVGAQTYGDHPSADKNAPQNVQAQPSSPPTAASGGDTPYSTTDKNAAQATQAQPSSPSDRTSVDSTSQSPVVKGATTNDQAETLNQESHKISSAKSTRSAQHAAKPRSKLEQTAMQGEKAYREALRQCAKEPDQNARDRCLDNAIQQFHRST